MADEPTPWEEINPPMASVRTAAPVSRSSAADETRIVFRNELTACLALTAPAGMSEESRRDWLMVAWDTLKHIPPDILSIGAKAARMKCDHPSKIVPTIIAETAERMTWRQPTPLEQKLSLPRPDYVTPEEAAQILEQYGLTHRKRADG